MLNLKLILIATCMFNSVLGIAANAVRAAPKPEVFPVSALGNVAAVQSIPSGDTRLWFQNVDRSISQIAASGPFTSGGRFESVFTLVPGSEVLSGTPIAAATVNGTSLQEIHLFFLSPTNILSEYIWDNFIGWHGGAGCTTCITTNQFVVQAGSKVLYVMGNDAAGNTADLRVGFVSAGAPGTFSEVNFTPAKGWQLAQLN
ncbi:hypothetical protein C8R43DRAFT_1207096 [Mycena crocata]|nr:hypothetical protein C8R43DRAFT_1207096 [Mycena crocata]